MRRWGHDDVMGADTSLMYIGAISFPPQSTRESDSDVRIECLNDIVLRASLSYPLTYTLRRHRVAPATSPGFAIPGSINMRLLASRWVLVSPAQRCPGVGCRGRRELKIEMSLFMIVPGRGDWRVDDIVARTIEPRLSVPSDCDEFVTCCC